MPRQLDENALKTCADTVETSIVKEHCARAEEDKDELTGAMPRQLS